MAASGIDVPWRARESARPIAVGAGLVLAAAGVLLALGRTPWCACGSAVPWSWDVWSRHNSQHLLDPYTFTHVLHGLGFFALTWLLLGRRVPLAWRAVITAGLESAWEVLENSPAVIERYRAETMSLDYFGDSVANSASDAGACLFGFWIASRLPWKWSVALFIATELVLLAWVRDSLVVNVIQLVWPIAAIKAWQTGAAY